MHVLSGAVVAATALIAVSTTGADPAGELIGAHVGPAAKSSPDDETRSPSASGQPTETATPTIPAQAGPPGSAPKAAVPVQAAAQNQPPARGRRAIQKQVATPGRTIRVAKGASIQAAVDSAQPGDTIVVSAGTYSGFQVSRSGRSGAYITIQAAPGANVVINGNSGGKGLVSLDGASFVRLVGLSIRGSSGFGVYAQGAANVELRDCEVSGSQDGGAVFLQSKNITVDHCEVRGNNARGTGAAHEAMSFDEVTGFEVAFNKVTGNGEEGIDAKYGSTGGKIHDNTSSANRGPNIYIDAASDIDIYNNVVTGATEASKAGIGLAVENFADVKRTSDVKIYNNVVSDNAGGGIGFWIESSGTFSDIQILNNTIKDNPHGGLNIADSSFSGSNILRNNIFSGNSTDVVGSVGSFIADHNLFGKGGSGSVKGAAHFVDDAQDDLRLDRDSAAIDAGSSAGAPAFDITGAPRKSGDIDLGAFEFQLPSLPNIDVPAVLADVDKTTAATIDKLHASIAEVLGVRPPTP